MQSVYIPEIASKESTIEQLKENSQKLKEQLEGLRKELQDTKALASSTTNEEIKILKTKIETQNAEHGKEVQVLKGEHSKELENWKQGKECKVMLIIQK